MDVLVVGGGVSGLSTALKLSRRGHSVTVLERDDTPMPDSADQAFFWDRRGAPQVRHSHAFLARLVGLLRQNEPDVLEMLVAAGATEMPFGQDIPPTINPQKQFTRQLEQHVLGTLTRTPRDQARFNSLLNKHAALWLRCTPSEHLLTLTPTQFTPLSASASACTPLPPPPSRKTSA